MTKSTTQQIDMFSGPPALVKRADQTLAEMAGRAGGKQLGALTDDRLRVLMLSAGMSCYASKNDNIASVMRWYLNGAGSS